jgi:glycosyltransferase involved in cell wall biosynthesis
LKLSIIIPVYNEQKLVCQVLDRIQTVSWPDTIKSVEIIVVDDCSVDGTFNELEKYKEEKNVQFSLFRHPHNMGKGAAVRTGISKSSGEIIIIQDADLELIPDDIPGMIRSMSELNVQFVNGSRYLPGIIRPLHSYKRYYFNKVFTKLASILINVRFTDLACGYKLFTRKVYDQISLNENRFGFEAELLIKVARLKRTQVTEVPVHYFPRNIGEGKKIRNVDGLRIFWVIVKYGLFNIK